MLKIPGRNAYLWKAGSYDVGDGESPACAQTTFSKVDAMGFESLKRAEAMRRLVRERYGVETQIVERRIKRNVDD